MTPKLRTLTVLLAALLGLGLVAPPVGAASQEIGPKVKVKGHALAPLDDATAGTAEDPAVGKTAPKLVGEGFDGEKVKVKHEEGTPRMLVFLSHSCPHCQAEVPVLVELAELGLLDGVEVDTITTNTSKNLPNYPPSKWLAREDWPFEPVLLDDKKLRAFDAYGGTAFPYFVFVAADGTVAARVTGELPANVIRNAAQRLVAGESLVD